MTIRTKALIIIGVSLLTMGGLLYISSRFTFLRGIQEIEEQRTSEIVEQVLDDLTHLISDLEADTAKHASSQETYAFIEDLNEEYIKSHFSDEIFIAARYNVVILVNSSGGVVFNKAIDLGRGEDVTGTSELLKQLLNSNFLVAKIKANGFQSGIILLSEGPVLISWQPILTSEGKGPSRGTLIIARHFDTSEIAYLTQFASYPIKLHPLNNITTPELNEALGILLTGETVLVSPTTDKIISGYSLLGDVFGKPILVMEIALPRDISQLGQVVARQAILVLLGVGLLVGGAAMFMVQTQILSRFTRLIQGVNSIADSGDTSTLITLDGNDELNLVAGTINGMLLSLEESSAEIRIREERYRDLFENTTDLIHSVSVDGHFLFVNNAWQQTLGYSQEEIADLTLQDIIHPDYRPYFMEMFQKAISGEASDSIEVVFVTKDGRAITVDGNVSCQRRKEEVVAIRGIFRDVTERKQAEVDIQTLYEQEREVTQQLEREISRRVEYTRALVHELKTPITPVLAAAELLLEEITDKRQLRLVQTIDRSAANLNQRIDELLDLARGELNMLELNLESIDPVSMLNELGNRMAIVAQRNGQSLVVQLPDSLPSLMADRQRIQQVILNLLNNAFKYTPTGGVITLSARTKGDNLVIEVHDTGQGIKEQDREKLFDPYYRRVEDRERLSGLGLGLALAKRLVELHNGKIWVTSEMGSGSTFGFSLPLETVDKRDKAL